MLISHRRQLRARFYSDSDRHAFVELLGVQCQSEDDISILTLTMDYSEIISACLPKIAGNSDITDTVLLAPERPTLSCYSVGHNILPPFSNGSAEIPKVKLRRDEAHKETCNDDTLVHTAITDSNVAKYPGLASTRSDWCTLLHLYSGILKRLRNSQHFPSRMHTSCKA